jgi:rfaE bifunctional protein kinase chain/domain
MTNAKEFVNAIKSQFNLTQIEETFKQFENLNILVIGDTIIDRYTFVHQKGRAIKDPIMSVEYKEEEDYAGAIIVVANHMSTFVKKIKLVTLIGEKNSMINFVQNSLRKNIELKTFVKTNAPTTVKQRMIDAYRSNKLFKIEYIDDHPINEQLNKEIVEYLDKEIPKYDIIIVGDYGHGFITHDMRRKIEEKARFLAINVQCNSSNMGYNYFNLYKKFDFLTINENEMRLPLSMRFEEMETVIKAAQSCFNMNNFLVTLGKKGSILCKEKKLTHGPIVIETVKDTVGSGDALFSISSLCAYFKLSDELLVFLANCAGGFASNVVGNKESITQERLMEFIKNVYNQDIE